MPDNPLCASREATIRKLDAAIFATADFDDVPWIEQDRHLLIQALDWERQKRADAERERDLLREEMGRCILAKGEA